MSDTAPSPPFAGRSRRRVLLWGALVALLLAVLAALLWLTWQHERNRLQDATEAAALSAATELRQRLVDDVQALQQLLWTDPAPETPAWTAPIQDVLRQRRELARIEWRNAGFEPVTSITSALHDSRFTALARSDMQVDAEVACAAARRFMAPTFSRSYFLPTGNGQGAEMVDLCIPRLQGGRTLGLVVATFVLPDLLEVAIPAALMRSHEILLVEPDGSRLAHAGPSRGRGVFRAERLVELAGLPLLLRLDSIADHPPLIANPNAALVMLLSIALSAVVVMLAYDVRRRSAAERRLAESLAFRKAMEDSLVTGLRARALDGRITYVNPAFCAMVGYSAEELLAANAAGRDVNHPHDPQNPHHPPYWPPEQIEEYTRRHAVRVAGNAPPREGHETLFMRCNGERFAVLIFEAPLVDGLGRQTGWMSTVLDVSAQRKVEELSRQQQEKLQAAARLATMGEMATLLSHELNQPLSAIASYATGTLNLLPEHAGDPPADLETQHMIRGAIGRVAEQAERAGRVIRSVHQFVRRRHRLHETLRADELIEAVLPLVRLAARRSHTRIEIDLPRPVPRVSCDRTMVEQVLLNLSRNGIQAMEEHTPADDRVLCLRVRRLDERWLEFAVIDRGAGISADVAAQLFTPFFTTKPEGMGMGLAMCRTVVEQHGGALDFDSTTASADTTATHGTTFRFTLPAPPPAQPLAEPAS